MRNTFCFILLLVFFVSLSTLHAQCVSEGILVSAAGTTTQGYNGDGGLAAAAKVNQPLGMAGDANGNIYFADGLNHIIRKIDTYGVISTVAGIPGISGFNQANGYSNLVTLNYPNDIAIGNNGMLYLVEGTSSLIRKVDLNSQTTSLIGGMPIGGIGYSGDGGPALNAQFFYPNGIAVNSIGEVYISDRFNNRIRKIDLAGIVTTVAGTGGTGYSGDGNIGTQALLNQPMSGEMDTDDNFYFIDLTNNAIRKIDALTGIITTVAGNGVPGFSGDGGLATQAQLSNPQGLALDSNNNLYISDSQNARIRRVDAVTGIITTIMGDGSQGFPSERDAANNASINPYSLFMSANQELYYSEWINHRILRLKCPPELTFYEAECTAVGGNWIISNHISASNGTSVLYPGIGKKLFNPPTDTDDIITFWVVVSEAGNYNIFTRTLVSNTFNDDLWVRINNGDWLEYSNLRKSLSFRWNQLHDGDINSPISVPFELGLNIIDIGVGEDGIRLDKLSISLSDEEPVGMGDGAGNCPSTITSDDFEDNSIDLDKNQFKLDAYPSPFFEEINLNLDSKTASNVKVVNTYGQIVWQQQALELGEYRINLKDFPAGMYFIHVENDLERKTLKVQKI